MKVRPSIWSITWRYLLVSLVVSIAVIGFFSTLFIGFDQETRTLYVLPWGISQIVMISILAAALIAIYILSVTLYYYVIEDTSFTVFRYGRQLSFDYKNIEFIDIEVSKKKNQVIFYSTKGKMRYMLGDKNGVLLETLIKKCPKTMSVEEFKRRHPEENTNN